MLNFATPILNCKEAAEFEAELLGSDEDKTWNAMSWVGMELGRAMLKDYREISQVLKAPRVLVLAGKGHNAGDAIIAAGEIAKIHPDATVDIYFALGQEGLKPLVEKALKGLEKFAAVDEAVVFSSSYHFCIDGIFGMSFTPPVREALAEFFNKINAHKDIRFRAAVDIPSGLAFQADFTYATGVAKTDLFKEDNRERVGRVRFLDIAFFKDEYKGRHESDEFILQPSILEPLRGLRDPLTDKRSYGHLFILSGSRNFPGALLMAVKAAVNSGVGLVTAFTPESLVASFSAEVPEAMWVPWPENDDGTLSSKGIDLLLSRLDRGTALLMGPGIGENPDTTMLLKDVLERVDIPIVVDASALVPEVFEGNKKPIIATPHAGEFKRIAGNISLHEWYEKTKVITYLKGSIGKIIYKNKIYHSPFGGPVLARGGSGDVLSGMIGALLAMWPDEHFKALSTAVVWHGMAGDLLAQCHGPVATKTTDLINFLLPALRHP